MKSQSELRELHGQEYAERFDKKQKPFRLQRLLGKIRLNPQDDVVDFACGNGMLMPFVAPMVRSYVGVDFSQAFIDLANARKSALGITNARYECATVEEFCKDKAGVFNVAFALDFAEHVYDDDWLAILTSIRACLAAGGRLYVHTPNAQFFMEVMRKAHFLVEDLPEHVAVRSLEESTALLKEAGFHIAKAALIPHYNIMRFTHPLSFVPLVGKYFKARIFIEAMK